MEPFVAIYVGCMLIISVGAIKILSKKFSKK